MKATAPLNLPFVAVGRTLRLGFTLSRRLAVPALGAAAIGAVIRKTKQADSWTVADPTPRAATGRAEVTPEPGRAPATQPIESAEDIVLPSELPIRSYDALPAKDAARAIRELSDDDEVRTVLEFEEQNAKRATVLTAARSRLNALDSHS